jgi:multimeric flavodoxin WrbA
MWKIYPLIADCSGLIIATPVFFGGPTSVLKGWIDRCNPFWKDRTVLKRNLRPTRPGALIATAGSGHGRAFTGTLEVIKSLFYSLGMKLEAQLLIGGLNDLDEPLPTDDHRAQAQQLGKKMAELERAADQPFHPDHPWWNHPPEQDQRPCGPM